MQFDDKPLERQNLHVPVVLDASGVHHKLNRLHLMDEDISNHQQTRHIYVHSKSSEYGLQKRDSFARVRRGLSATGDRVNISSLVCAPIARPNRLSITHKTLRSLREKTKGALNREKENPRD